MSLGELLLNPQLAAVLQRGAGGLLRAQKAADERRPQGEDQSRVVMKFEEKRQLLQAICDRRERLFGQAAAKMKPAQKQALWEEVSEGVP